VLPAAPTRCLISMVLAAYAGTVWAVLEATQGPTAMALEREVRPQAKVTWYPGVRLFCTCSHATANVADVSLQPRPLSPCSSRNCWC